MKTFLHYVGKFSLKALIDKHEQKAIEEKFQELVRLAGISPDAISYKWHSWGQMPHKGYCALRLSKLEIPAQFQIIRKKHLEVTLPVQSIE